MPSDLPAARALRGQSAPTWRRRAATGALTPAGHQFSAGPVVADPDREARIAAHTRRIQKRLRALVPGLARCWGCGRVARNRRVKEMGWHSRRVDLGSGRPTTEVHCPACFARWGWIEERGW